MKITGIKTYVLQATLGDYAFGWSQRVGNSRQTAICVVETDAGIEGYGEAFYFGGPSTIVALMMEQACGPHIVGMDPFDTSVIWDKLYNLMRDQGQKGVTISAISAIDIALWDIKGKALGLPVYKLLGGAYRTKAQSLRHRPLRTAGRAQHRGRARRRGRGLQGAGLRRDEAQDRLRPQDRRRVRPRHPRGHRPRPGPDGGRQPRLQRHRGHQTGARAGTVRHHLVRGAGPAGRHRRLRGDQAQHQHPHRGRRVRVHALRLPRADPPPRRGRAPAGYVRHRRLHRDAQHRGDGECGQPARHPPRLGHERRPGGVVAVLRRAAQLPGAPLPGRAVVRVRPLPQPPARDERGEIHNGGRLPADSRPSRAGHHAGYGLHRATTP